MLQGILTKLFNKTASETGRDCLVNYVWINKEPDSDNRKAACSVSLKHLDCAYKSAKQYPDAKFKIWLDFKLLDERSRACLQKHYKLFAPKNAALCDLNDIAQYRDEALFDRSTNKKIWARVDLARVIVLDHVLATEPEQHAVYADFDVKDLRLAEAKEKTTKHGVAAASTGARTAFNDFFFPSETRGGGHENGYFAFQKGPKGTGYLKVLLFETFKDARENQTGFRALTGTIWDWAAAENVSCDELTIPHVLYQQGYIIPNNYGYKLLNWNKLSWDR